MRRLRGRMVTCQGLCRGNFLMQHHPTYVTPSYLSAPFYSCTESIHTMCTPSYVSTTCTILRAPSSYSHMLQAAFRGTLTGAVTMIEHLTFLRAPDYSNSITNSSCQPIPGAVPSVPSAYQMSILLPIRIQSPHAFKNHARVCRAQTWVSGMPS